MSSRLRVVIIGTGSISHSHAQAIGLTPELSLVGCYNRPEEKLIGQSFARKYQTCYYDSVDRMLEIESPDITVNVLPPRYRTVGLMRAASMGSHLVAEKPFALSMSDCKQIIESAKENRVILAVSESSAFDPVNQSIISYRRRMGATIHMLDTNYRYYFTPDRPAWCYHPKDGMGGMIMNVGVHRIARLRLLAGAPECAVNASLGKRDCHRPVEGDASIFIRYSNGAAGVVLMCGYHQTGEHKLNVTRIVTEDGFVTQSGQDVTFIGSNGQSQMIPIPENIGRNRYLNFYQSLIKAIVNQEPSPYSGEQGQRDVAVILAAMKSANDNREVNINEILDLQPAAVLPVR